MTLTQKDLERLREYHKNREFFIPTMSVRSIPLSELLDRLSALEKLREASYGLNFGTDWNKGTHAIKYGYRKKLLKALKNCPALPEGD